MSLIVEALRKAQHERHADTSRPAIEVRHAAPGRKTRWLPVSAAFVVAGLAVTGAYLLGSSSAEHPDTVRVATKEPRLVSPQTVPPSKPSPSRPAHIEPVKTEAPPPVAPAAHHDEANAMPMEAMLARPATAPAPVVALPAALPRKPSPAETPADSAKATRKPRLTAPHEAQPRSASDRASKVASIDEKPPDIPIIQNLPAEIRNRLPALKLSIHVYSDDPDKRLVLINSRRYREGDAVSDDVTLDRITPTGAVLRTRGISFRLVIEG